MNNCFQRKAKKIMSQEDERSRKNEPEQREDKALLKQKKRQQKKQTDDETEKISGRVIDPQKLQALKKDFEEIEINQWQTSNRKKSTYLAAIQKQLKNFELLQQQKIEKIDPQQQEKQLIIKKRREADKQLAKKIAEDLRKKNYSQQKIALLCQQTCPKYKIQNYYNNLVPQNYLRYINIFSNQFRTGEEKDQTQYKGMLSEIVNQIGKQRLKSALECSDDQNKKLNLQSWKLLQWAHQFIIKNKQIYFQAFKIQDEFFERRVRKLFFQRAFNNFFRLFSEVSQIQPNKRMIQAYKTMFQSPNRYFPHFVKQSHVYQSQKLTKELKKLVQTIKSSLLIRNIIGYYLYDLKLRCKCYKQFMSLNQQNLKECLLKLKIFFIDSPMEPLCGVTQTADKTQQYPIFINFYKLHKQFSENIEYNKGIYLSYALCVIVHQIGHAIPRKIKLIEDEEDSNPYRVKFKDQKDGGWMLEHLAFGAAMDQILSNDYQKVKTLLESEVDVIKLKMYKPQIFLFNLKEYQNAKKKLKEEQSNQKKGRNSKFRKAQGQSLFNSDIIIQLESLGLKQYILNKEFMQRCSIQNLSKAQSQLEKKTPIQMYKQTFYNIIQVNYEQAQLNQKEKKKLQQTIQKLQIFHNLCKKTDKIIEEEIKNNHVLRFKAKQTNPILSYRPEFVRRNDQVQRLIYKSYKQ